MDMSKDLATLNLPALLMERAKEALCKVLISMESDIKALVDDQSIVAIQSGIMEDTPEDFGVVRYAALYHAQSIMNPHWRKFTAEQKTQFERHLEGDRFVSVTLNIPNNGQLAISAPVTPQGTFDKGRLKLNVDLALGTLYHVDAMACIVKLEALSLLSAPNYVESKQ